MLNKLRLCTITKEILRRIFPYGFLICILLVEMYAAYYHKRDILIDRFSLISLITLFFSLHLLEVKIRGWKMILTLLLLWIIGLILTVHSGFLFGNGGGFTLENCIHILQLTMILEYIKMCPVQAFWLILLAVAFPFLILGSGFLLHWSICPLPRSQFVKITGGIFCAVSAAVLIGYFTPAYEVQALLKAYDYVQLNQSVYLTAGVKFSPVNADDVKATPGKNLVFIILESTELTFLDEKLFPGLVPNLKNFSQESQLFTNIAMARTSFGTYGALNSMILGTYVTPKYLKHAYTLENYEGNQLSSFPRILNKAGYKQYFLMGCAGNFAGTNRLVKDHQYDVTWFGIENAPREKRWSLSVRDSVVFEQVWKFYQEASKGGRPFNITALSVDAHGPNGYYDPKEPPYPRQGKTIYPLFNAMYASDHALGKLLERIRKSPEGKNTCIVITSDHLAHRFTDTGGKLESVPNRKMLFMIWNSSVRKFSSGVSGLTFDEAPTILDALGVKHNYTFPLGESLYSETLDERRLKASEEQLAALNSYISLKSRHPVKLPQPISMARKPWLMLQVGEFRIPLQVEDHIEDLPHGNEMFLLKIPDDRIIRNPRLQYYKRFFAGIAAIDKCSGCVWLQENSKTAAAYFKHPESRGYILGLKINGKRVIKSASRIEDLSFRSQEVQALLK